MKRITIILFTLLLALNISLSGAQEEQLTGTLFGEHEGYTLFTAQGTNRVYLIDDQGRLINEWAVRSNGRDAFLRENGNLVVTMAPETPIANDYASHIGFVQIDGGFAEYTWDGDLVWSYDFDRPGYRIHHGVTLIPNGNIMFIAWHLISTEEALAAGRDPELIGEGIWPDAIFEYSPELDEIVWEWHVWDHIIQDFDPDAPNYGVIADNPHLIDLNFTEFGQWIEDWQHSNSIAYNAELDQIALNPREYHEIWIIDHSISTEEAQGPAGDLLYRWGNPRAYDSGDENDKHLLYQHDVQWIPEGFPGAGNMILFSNRHELVTDDDEEPMPFSRIVEFTPAMDADGNYIMNVGEDYLPAEPAWTYDGLPDDPFYSRFASGVERLPDGNTLITAASPGHLYEVTMDGERVWEYIPPLRGNSLIGPGNEPTSIIFRSRRYYANSPILQGLDLTPGLTLEEMASIDQDHAVTLVYDDVYNSQLSGEHPAHYYTFRAEANQLINLTIQADDAAAPVMTLTHGDFETVVAASDTGSIDEFRLLDGGIYHVTVTDASGNDITADYTLQLANLGRPFEGVDESIPRLFYGTDLQNTLTPEDPSSIFAFFGNAGESVVITATRANGTVQPQIDLLDADQIVILTVVADDAGMAILNYSIDSDGVYYMQISHNQGDANADNAQGVVDVLLDVDESQ